MRRNLDKMLIEVNKKRRLLRYYKGKERKKSGNDSDSVRKRRESVLEGEVRELENECLLFSQWEVHR